MPHFEKRRTLFAEESDNVIESDEDFEIRLIWPWNATLGDPFTTTVTIIDNDPTVQFEQAAYQAAEDIGTVPITVTLNAAPSLTVTVQYSTTDITAAANTGYAPSAGVITFTPQVTAALISIPILDDTLIEPPETFAVSLDTPWNATLGSPDTTTVTIVDSTGNTTISLTSEPNPSVFAQATTFTATVTSPGGTPPGTIQFYVDGATFGSPITLTDGTAVTSTAALTVGSHPITAMYSDDTNYNISTSATYTHTVNKASTTIIVTSLPNPSSFGQAVTFTATVASAGGTPAGTVQFYVDGVALGAAQNLSSSSATTVTSTLSVSTHIITATYIGNANYNLSTSSLLNQQVGKASATITLDRLTQTYTGVQRPITATTSPLGLAVVITYTGISGTVYGPTQIAPTDAGTYLVTATISDTNYQGNANNTLIVNRASTTVSLTSLPNPATYGQLVTFTATMTTSSPGGGTPIGSITFTIATLSVNVPLDANGQAVYLTTTLPVGTHPITATYSATDNFNVSSGALSGGQVVNDTTITDVTAINSSPTGLHNTTYFTATTTGNNVAYQWDFGDGQLGSGATASHIYTATGSYTATVTATNGASSIPATTLVTIDPIRVYLPLVRR